MTLQTLNFKNKLKNMLLTSSLVSAYEHGATKLT